MSEINYSNYSIATVFKNTLKVTTENLKLYGIIAAVLVVFNILSTFILYDDTASMGTSSAMFNLGGIVVLLFSTVFYLGLYVVVTDNAFGTLSNQEYQGGPYLNRILSVIFPMIGLSLVLGVFIGIGFILLIIPGIYLMLKYYVAFPVKIIENRSVFDSISRSNELTNGHKMSIFVTILIVFAVLFVFVFGSTMFLIGSVVQSGEASALQSPFFILVSSIFNAGFSIFGLIFPAAIYYELLDDLTT